MLFLLQCAADNSLCIVDSIAVMCDETAVQIDDEVQFFYNKKVCLGKVVEISVLMTKQKMLRNVPKAKLSHKDQRPTKKPRHFISSGDDHQEKTSVGKNKKPRPITAKKQATKCQQSQVIQVIKSLENKGASTMTRTTTKLDHPKDASTDDSTESDDSDSYIMNRKELSDAKKSYVANLRALTKSSSQSSDPESVIAVNSVSHSPTKEELKRMLKEERAKNILTASRRIDNDINMNREDENHIRRSSPENDEDLEIRRNRPVNEKQLFGKNFQDDKMMLLLNGIYCKVKCHDSALGASTKCSHLVRRLLEGVFTRETLLKCTSTGKPGALASKEHKQLESLDDTAKNAIIDYAIVISQTKGWPIPPREKFTSIMSQKLGEIKREERNAQRQLQRQ